MKVREAGDVHRSEMEIYRPLLLTLSILYEILSNSRASSTNPIQTTFQNYRRRTALSNNDNCVCFENPTSETLDQVLDEEESGLERLIIYIYKDSQNKLKLYIPNIRKQLNFPDFAFENGDLIDPDAQQSISTVFNTSPNVITVNPKKISSQDNNINNPAPGQIYSKPNVVHSIQIIPGRGIVHKHVLLPSQGIHNYINPANQIKAKLENLINSHNNGKPAGYENILFQGKPIGPIFTLFDQSIKNINDTNSKTFNQWFDEEMEHTDVAESIKSNPLQLSTLEDSIQTILTDHGIKISSKGILTDDNGNVLDMSNLHLRPVLIGDTFEYEKVKNGSKNSTFSLPSDLPYLESLLVTLQNPPKILGVIPLRKIYIPSGAPLHTHTEQDTAYVENEEIQLPLLTDKLHTDIDTSSVKLTKKEQNVKKKAQHQDKILVHSHQVEESPVPDYSKVTNNDDIEDFKPPRNDEKRRNQGDKDDNFVEVANLLKESGYIPAGAPSGMVAALLHQMVGQNSGAEALIKVYAQQVAQKGKTVKKVEAIAENDVHDFNGIPRSNPRSEKDSGRSSSLLGKVVGRVLDGLLSRRQQVSKIVDDLTGPDFRIIGGAAATGSGSPISNRGRSGFIF